TLHNYRVAFRASPGLLDLPLAKIKHADVLAAVRSWDVKPLTAVNRLSCLSRVFNHAIRPYRLLVVNPTADIKVRVDKQHKVKALTADALEAFLAKVAADAPPAFVIICQLAGLAGLRLSEALGLTWSDVDFSAATITISGQLGLAGKQRTPPKSANGYRTIPAPPRLLAALAAYRRETIPHINGLVVGNAIARSTVLTYARRYTNRAFTLHALRHTYATTLLANGVDVRTVAALIGDDVKTVLSTYIHYTDDMRAQAAEDIKKIFG
ncbi:MAG: site-specific integrase, partial [Veillonellaceae bacterium]|nr:site-specific integrase [Veillonellaceae bacterium]